jgi:hypothetical protein
VTISSNNVGIGTADANNILQVGNAGKLKIGMVLLINHS